MKRLLLGIALVAVPLASPGFGAEAKLRYAAAAYFDKDGRGMRGPEGVACTDDFRIVVADTGNGRLIRYTFDGEQFKGGEEVALPAGAYPTRVQIGSKGQVLALDARQRRLVRAAAGAGAADYLEIAGVPDPKLEMIRSFRLDKDDNLYLLDSANSRVVVLDPQAQFKKVIPLPEGMRSADDLAVDARGTLYVLDGVGGAIYQSSGGEFAPVTTKLREYLNFSSDLTVDPKGFLYLADQAGGGIVYLSTDGTFQARHSSVGWREGLLRHPTQLCANGRAVIVADRDNNRVELFLAAQ